MRKKFAIEIETNCRFKNRDVCNKNNLLCQECIKKTIEYHNSTTKVISVKEIELDARSP